MKELAGGKRMLNSIFPITENWSWLTFFLYLIVSLLTVSMCKRGIKYKESQNHNEAVRGRKSIDSIICFIVAWALLVLLATLRDDTVGTDMKNYIPYFLSKTSVDFDWKDFFSFHQREPAFQYYIYLLRSFTSNYTVLYFYTYSLVAFSYIYYIFSTWTSSNSFIFLHIFIFYYYSNMSGMRSAMGSAFIILSFVALYHRSYLKAFVLTVIGILFHYTMIFNIYIILAHWILSERKLKEKKSLWIALIISTIAFANVGLYFLQAVISETKYDYYSVDSSETSLLGSMFFVVLGAFCIYYYKSIIHKDFITVTNMIICMAMLAAYPLLFVTGAYRVPYYYILPRLFIWSSIVDETKKRFPSRAYLLLDISIVCIVIIYLLLKFTKSSLDGGFIYHFK